MKTLIWKKSIFTNTYKIYSESKEIGQLTKHKFSAWSEAEMNGKKFKYYSKGFFKRSSEIYDESDVKIGDIKFTAWKRKAEIHLNSNYQYWRYNTLFNTKWVMQNDKQIQINSSANTFSGSIETNAEDEISILTGLFVTNHYRENIIPVGLAVLAPLCLIIF
ncbi:hypothetical protein ACT3CE_10155 [Marinifilum sp. RC60d5]|uniref:hypothetical protein n=1 Tax=Marinifilum sp. RC60d5 TaxID=3458414 RepID=UPI0040351087